MGSCISVKYEVKEKDLFDKKFKPAVLKQMKDTVERVAKKYKSKGLELDDKCKEGWLLTASVTSLSVDDPAKAKSIEAQVSIDGAYFGKGGGKKMSAKGKAKASGIRANKLEDEARMIVNEALGSVLDNKVVPAVLK